jgi:hypothetical protein
LVDKLIKKGNFLNSSDWVLYAVLDAIVDLVLIHVNGIVMEGEALDELVPFYVISR